MIKDLVPSEKTIAPGDIVYHVRTGGKPIVTEVDSAGVSLKSGYGPVTEDARFSYNQLETRETMVLRDTEDGGLEVTALSHNLRTAFDSSRKLK